MAGVGEPDIIVDGAASPHTYSLRPSAAGAIENADLIFWVGPNIETFLESPLETLGRDAKVVRLDQTHGLELLKIREGGTFEAHDHDHGEHAGHDHGDDHAEHASAEHASHDHGDDHAEHAGHDHGEKHAEEAGHDHGHDHAEDAGHDHGDDHAEHASAEHAGHDHGDDHAEHAGHDHGEKHAEEAGHDHGHDHAEHASAEHAGHDHGDDHAEHASAEHAGHDHGDDHAEHAGHDHGGHHHSEFDAHVWLDPANAKAMVAEIEEALAAADPDHADQYAQNARDLVARLDTLTTEVSATIEPVRGKSFIVFHDAYPYFENRFGVSAAGSITVSPEVVPGASRVSEIKDKVGELGATCVFSEPQFEPKLVEVITEGTAANSGVLDPLGASLENGPDLYFQLIQNLADSMRDCLSGSS
ncbi:MAG: zinc ABC transporter substrate-binding protein [Pseudomonadota bacterium]